MTLLLGDYDITSYDSSKIDLKTPELVAIRLRKSLSAPTEIQNFSNRSEDPADEELRLRLFSNAIISANLVSYEQLPTWLKQFDGVIHDTRELGGSIIQNSLGINMLKISDWIVIMLPKLQSAAHADQIVDFLQTYYNENTTVTHWIFDLSAVTKYSSAILGYMIKVQRRLVARHRFLLLLWLRSDVMPEPLRIAMQKHFNLVNKGTFLISKLC